MTNTFVAQDSTNVTQWTNVDVLTSGEKHSSVFNKISTMFKNIRYLYKMLGTADISTLGDGADIGTVTGALSKLNSDLQNKKRHYSSTVSFVNTIGDTNIHGLPNLLDTIVVPNISNYKNGDFVELANGGTVYEGAIFKYTDTYWNIFFCGYAPRTNSFIIAGRFGDRYNYTIWS